MSSSQHSWEQPSGESHGWEDESASDGPDFDPGTWGEHDGADWEPRTPARYAEDFLAFLLSIYSAGQVSAKSLCILCYYASRAGMPFVERFGLAPGKSSGHYSRRVHGALAKEEGGSDELYSIQVPGHRRHDLSRTTHTLKVMPGHESLAKEMERDPSLSLRIREAIDEDTLPPSYMEHPVVQDSATPVLPVGLYVDAVPYSRTDSVIGMWLVNLLTNSRHLMVVFRKRLACRCGCKGWCSFDSLFRFVRWTLEALSSGQYPMQRHDMKPWLADDSSRLAAAGKPMKMRSAVVFVKGDWSEYCSSFGHPTWQSNLRPCLFCSATKENFHDTVGVGPLSLPHHTTTDEDYFQACARCERVLSIGLNEHILIKSALRYDKRPDGSHGLALSRALPELGLEQGDRLEPSTSLSDVGLFFGITDFPAELVFWRPSLQSVATHRNPLWSPSIGLTPYRCFTVDELHALHLGVYKEFCKRAVWVLLNSHVWGAGETTESEKHQIGVLCLRSELTSWYKHRESMFADGFTRVHDLTVKMLGTAESPMLPLSGAEIWGLMVFLTDALQKYSGQTPPEARQLLEAGQKLVRFQNVLSGMRANPTRAGIQELRKDVPYETTLRGPAGIKLWGGV